MRPAPPDVVRRALAAVTVWPVVLDPPPDQPRLQSLPDLVTSGLAQRVCDRMTHAGVAPPLRVGESAVVMGIASRLWSLTVVPAARHGVLVDPAVIAGRDDAGAVELGVTALRGHLDPGPDDVAEVVLAVLRPLVAAVPLSARLLWGNVAASLHSVPRVHDLPRAQPLVDALLDRAPLAGELDELPGGRARRRTCCLFYLVPGGGLCGDCVLDAVPRTAGGGMGP